MTIVLVVQGRNIKTAVAEDSNSLQFFTANYKRGEQIILAYPFYKYNERGATIDNTNGRSNKRIKCIKK
jgi:hypothetical protein